MKRLILYGGLGLVVAAGLGLVFIINSIGWQVVFGPDARPVTDRAFEPTAARLGRGQYLAEGPAHCFHCHSPHDTSSPTLPTIVAMKGAGWEMPIPELGQVNARNITSDIETGLGAWTDDEIARAIREGVSRDGTALAPIMPFIQFAHLDDEDVASIVVYLRTLPAVSNVVARSEVIFPLNYIMKTIPTPITEPRPAHPASTAVERGEYVATVAQCSSCHTPADDQGLPLPGLVFGGGAIFSDPSRNMAPVASMNITSDASGIAHYDEAMFADVLRSGRLPGRALTHVMPFEYFRNLTDQDLSDIFTYLRAQPPVQHRVSNEDSPELCAVCGQTHGLGNLNRR